MLSVLTSEENERKPLHERVGKSRPFKLRIASVSGLKTTCWLNRSSSCLVHIIKYVFIYIYIHICVARRTIKVSRASETNRVSIFLDVESVFFVFFNINASTPQRRESIKKNNQCSKKKTTKNNLKCNILSGYFFEMCFTAYPRNVYNSTISVKKNPSPCTNNSTTILNSVTQEWVAEDDAIVPAFPPALPHRSRSLVRDRYYIVRRL